MKDELGRPSIDVICQHTKDGQIIPLRVRLQDDDNMFQTYTVKSYKVLDRFGYLHRFKCNILVFNVLKSINIYYNPNNNIWRLDGIE